MTVDQTVTTQRLVALLTACNARRADVIGHLTNDWTREELLMVAVQACGMLITEIDVTAETTGLSTTEYLQAVGLAVARNLT